jgi:methylated-DNA-[protein]-cysteine S-methyltransferase
MAEYSAVIPFPAMNVGIRASDTLSGVRYLPRPRRSRIRRAGFAAERVVRAWSATATTRTRSSDLPLTIGGTSSSVASGGCSESRARLVTYGDVAEALGGAARAVGQACGREPACRSSSPATAVIAAGGIGGSGIARRLPLEARSVGCSRQRAAL